MKTIARPQLDNYAVDVSATEVCYDCELLHNALAKHGRVEAVFPHCERCKWAALYEVEE